VSHRWRFVLAVLLLASPLAAAPPRAGSEFQVNTWTTGAQRFTAAAAAPDGHFVITWESFGQDGDNGGVFGQVFDPAGQPVGAEFQANQYTTGRQGLPAVAMAPNGDFLVVWITRDVDAPGGAGVFARHFDNVGNPDGGEFLVNVYTTGEQLGPAVAADAAGRFVVVWTSLAQGIVGRRFDSTMTGGGEFQVTAASGGQNFADLAMAPDGSFVATWASFQDLDGAGVVGRRFDATDTPMSAEFAVNTYTTLDQDRPSVALLGGGGFVVVWESNGQDGSARGLFGQRFDAAASRVGGEFVVNTDTTGTQSYVDVAGDAAGGFLVTWNSSDGDLAGIFGRSFDATGTAVDTPEFRVNTYTTGQQVIAALASDADGRFVVAWQGSPEADGYGIRAQRFGDLIFKDGFEKGGTGRWTLASTDGGDLAVTSAAAMGGTLEGLEGNVNDVNPLFVEDDSPIAEPRYRARFYIDPRSFDTGEAEGHHRTRTFIAFSEAPARRVAAVVLRRQGGVLALGFRARLDDNSQADTAFFPLAAGPRPVEIDLVRASAPGVADGSLEVWIDGIAVAKLTGLTNSLAGVDFARLGGLSIKSGAAGTMYWDEFESRRQSYIGPLP